MKKISVILGALALGCVAMFTSCNQEVAANGSNSYWCDVNATITPDEKQKDYFVSPKAVDGYVSWTEADGSNYTVYDLEVDYTYYTSKDAKDPTDDTWRVQIRDFDGEYALIYTYPLADEKKCTLTVDGDLDDDEFTVKVVYPAGSQVSSVEATFTRK